MIEDYHVSSEKFQLHFVENSWTQAWMTLAIKRIERAKVLHIKTHVISHYLKARKAICVNWN